MVSICLLSLSLCSSRFEDFSTQACNTTSEVTNPDTVELTMLGCAMLTQSNLGNTRFWQLFWLSHVTVGLSVFLLELFSFFATSSMCLALFFRSIFAS